MRGCGAIQPSGRIVSTTRWPRATRTGHSARPMNPPEPVTRMRAMRPLPVAPTAFGAKSDCKQGYGPLGRNRATLRAISFAQRDGRGGGDRRAAAHRVAAEARLSGHRGLVFLLAPPAGGAG